MNKHEGSQIYNQFRSLYQEMTPTPTLIWMIPLHRQCDDVTADIFQKIMRKILSIRTPVEFRLAEDKNRRLDCSSD